MEKRVFLAIFLSFAILAVWQAYFAPKPLPRPPQEPTQTAKPGEAIPPPPAAAKPETTTPPPGEPLPTEPVARDVTIDTEAVHAVFSTRGAVLKSWKLKKYLDAGRQPLEFVPSNFGQSYPLPFTLAVDDPALSRMLATANFEPSADSLTLGSTPGTLSFQYRDASGLNAMKRFNFQPDGKAYGINVEAAVDVKGTAQPVTIQFGPMLGVGYNPDDSQSRPVRAIQYLDDDVERLAADALQQQGRYEGQMRFAGVEEHYFLVAALPGAQSVQVKYEPISIPIPGDAEARSQTFIGFGVRTPAATGTSKVLFFLGPKDFHILKFVDPNLVWAIDFGIFRFLAVPLLSALKWINEFVGNWGWSIVTLTILINLAIFPLRHRSMVSMRKMQSLQPEVKAIQERYAKYKLTDPERQKMNQEMMALYKQKGVNPASGCVPMLLTMPILFAFYALLSEAIEIRGAPFLGWIDDLSRHDPLYITPVLMGATMLWQQRMMPTTADPVQQKVFLILPVVFTVTFLWFPSGLVVYWLVSNLMAIAQQYVTYRLIGAPATPPRRPAPAIAKGRTQK